MHEITLNSIETLSAAIVILLIGRFLRNRVAFFREFFIPVPVIGGFVFSLITLYLHYNGGYNFKFDGNLKTLAMVAFFTTIGFMASMKFLLKGGYLVGVFLLGAIILTIIQNVVGVSLAKVFGLDPLLGLAAGSISLTGGHGTSAAFGPVLEQAGATGATAVAIASATYGLIAGCLIGGPIAKNLMKKYNLQYVEDGSVLDATVFDKTPGMIRQTHLDVTEFSLLDAIVYITISMGIGTWVITYLKGVGITLPIYLGPMFVAAIIRNIVDMTKIEIPEKEIKITGHIALSLFLAMALMSLRLWDIAALAMPLISILLIQTLVTGIFAYVVTFKILGSNYDAAVMSCGHCGFAMGATPNAIANMESFTTANFPSPKSFFVIPLVGSLFIDFFNASIIMGFVGYLR